MGSSDTVEPAQQQPEEQAVAAEEQPFSVLVAPPAAKGAQPVRLESVSPSDTVVSLRQLIAEFPALACFTCYHLEAQSLADGAWRPLNDFVELAEYEDVADGATLRMVLDKYDARKVRAHVRRFRDVLSNPPIPQATTEPEAQPEAAADASKVEEPAEGEEMDEKKLKEISEQQLKRLREIHHKLEGVEVPVKPELAEFYNFPGAAPAAQEESEQAEQTPAKGKDQKKSKKGKKNKQKQQNDASQQKEQEQQQQPDAKLPACVKSIVFSGYNPPPGPRKLAGDLLYLEVVVAGDNTRYHITAHVNGFFVNRSTASKFDPRPHKTAAAHSHLLLNVMSTVSPKFRESYAALLAKAASLAKEGPSSIEWMVAAGSSLGGKLPWNTPVAAATEEHTYDLNRAEDELCSSFGMDERGVLRDWNEEYQCCRELPTKSLNEEIVRARVMYKIVTEFVEAATQGAVAIVEGNIPPINPMDDKSAHVYVFNNIFFSVSIDGKSSADAGGEENAYSAANRDLQGVKAFNEVDVCDLHTLATTVVDYLGVRVIAQSLIPGILMGDASSKLVYGSVDHGKTIAANSSMHKLMLKAGEKLHIAERSIKPLGKSEEELAAEKEQESLGGPPVSGGEASTEVATICGAVEAKGIQGSDGRLYVLDLVRITPKDWTFYKNRETAQKNTEEKASAPEDDGLCFTRDDEGYVALLRPELVQLYSLWKQNQARRANREARIAAKEAKEAEAQKDKKEGETSEAGDEKNATEKKETDKGELEEEEEEVPSVVLNPNVFMDYPASTDAAQIEADEAAAKDAAEYLQKIVVPAFVADVRRGAIAPADGYALTELMHSCGINMRYLGRLASLAKKLEAINGISKYLLEMLEVEMISRAAKHILADVLNSNDSIRAAPGSAIVKLLNSILGSTSAAVEKGDDDADTNGSDAIAITTASLNVKSLWARIDKEIRARFDYELSLWGPGREVVQSENAISLGRVQKPVLLRRLCQRLGLRVVSRNYDFSSSCAAPITLDDITGVVPVVKSSLPAHPLTQAKQLLERGRVHLSQGALSSSYEFLQEASSLLFQVCGAAHEDAALCSSSLATVLYHAGDVAGAIVQQQRALALYTQLQGIDYHDTAFAHANLALFLHANAQTELAVPHIRRAIYLLELTWGKLRWR
ncbi:putative eukaryotic translation initiation factor 3 subunit [Phytophthora cinnamomi]|uniref:putative eukaryotic translation initiation factor 3 subunit n=1 Tax=Phytophthora cinnamomi TaxID=4785 RepID=UPI00355A294F|nr:putative eukaryotic translation initiation factor 3 subunit [Phytophthora cinnamomi]